MRIITRLNIGGPARQAIMLTNRLHGHGFTTALVTGSVGDREGEVQAAPGPEPVRLGHLRRGVDPRSDVRALYELRRLMAERPPAIVHTHMAKAGTLGRMAAFHQRVPVVVHTFHGHVLKEYFSPSVSKVFEVAERRLATRCDALIAVSASVRDDLFDLGIGRQEQWRVVPLGLELDDLLGPPPDSRVAREALGIKQDAPLVGIVGRLAPIKDHQTFLAACEHVLRERPDVHFVIAGDGELRASLESQAAPLDRHVSFLGWVTDLPALYSALDVVVLTSRNEGTPVALIEAAAAAKPVVSTRVGGVADVVLQGRSGYLEAPGDAAAVAARILELLDSGQMREEFGAAGRRHVEQRFSSDRLVEDLVALYGELLDKKLSR